MNEQVRWTIARIGLINFWYYDDQEFVFNQGKLLLRGANGSGKSVTMQSFIPLLFDGNKSPERLDPFGSRARKLENYLLGEDEQDRTENTGYLYMEFEKPDTGVTLTIGMGLRARRGRPLEFWGFSVTDGRRIGRELMLYKDVGEKIPLSKIELRNRVGEGGEVHETQREYMEMVNKLLYGYEDPEEYDELIKLLVQIRTPKLSRDFKPTVIYEIMNNSLQPLSDDDLRPLSEAIENMDKIRDRLEMLQTSEKAAGKLKLEYDRYNRFVLLEKAEEYLKHADRLGEAKKTAEDLRRKSAEHQAAYEQYESERQALESRRETLEHRKRQLEQNDGFRIKQEIVELEKKQTEWARKIGEKEASLRQKRDRETALGYKVRDAKEQRDRQEKEILETLDAMAELAESVFFDENAFVSAELREDLRKPYAFRSLRSDVERYRTRIAETRTALEEQRRREQAFDDKAQELDRAKKERSDAEREQNKTRSLLEASREEYTEKLFAWEKANVLLKIAHAEMPEIVRAVNAYGEETTFDDIREKARRHYTAHENRFREQIHSHTLVLRGQEEVLARLRQELQDWRTKTDPEPVRAEKTERSRKALEAAAVPYIPFYKAVDFKSDAPEEIKGRIEEALADMGLLDALIVPSHLRDKLPKPGADEGDRIIIPNPQFFRHDLSFYLEPSLPVDSQITSEDVGDTLRSIFLEDDGSAAYVNEQGEYRIGLLRGFTTQTYAPKYLGIEARKRYRKERIEALEDEIARAAEQIEEQRARIAAVESQIVRLGAEMAAMPGKDDLETAYQMMRSAESVLTARESEVRRIQDAADKLYTALKEAREHVRTLTHGLMIPPTLRDFTDAEAAVQKYAATVPELESLHTGFLGTIAIISQLGEQLEEIAADLDDLSVDLRELRRDTDKVLSQLDNLRAILKESDYEEIASEVDACIRDLNEIPAKLEAAIRSSEQNRSAHQAAIDALEKAAAQTAGLERLEDAAGESFRMEQALGYTAKADDQAAAKLDPQEGEKAAVHTPAMSEQQTATKPAKPISLYETAKKTAAQLRTHEKGQRTREEYNSALSAKFYENSQYLLEYNLRIDLAFEQQSDAQTLAQPELSALLAKRKRQEIMAKVRGRDASFYAMIDDIRESIEENERLLRESDRQLFEDILANTVGKKIRAKIYHSEEWVKKINTLMESMNTSSGLSFSLSWKKNVADTEDQLDTRELIDLLQSDAVLLSEEQMGRLTMHFRSKIAEARKTMESGGSALSFHTIMRDILDYRKWFEFRLFYKKTGENRRELTDNAFYKFSGGEKAMAMYVPLFSSIYARFDGASHKDCPRVISLDEAFAGVDDNNIADMFRLVEELRLDYVINSQVLWGDFESVPALAIYELIRPNNADCVTTIRYSWNGRMRTLEV